MERWNKTFLDFLSAQILEATWNVFDSCVLHVSFIIIKKFTKIINKLCLSDFFSKRLSKFWKVLSKTKSYLPRSVLTNFLESFKNMFLIFFVWKIISNFYKRLKTYYSDRFLAILWESLECRKQFSEKIFFIKFNSKIPNLLSASSFNHSVINLTKLDKFRS